MCKTGTLNDYIIFVNHAMMKCNVQCEFIIYFVVFQKEESIFSQMSNR